MRGKRKPATAAAPNAAKRNRRRSRHARRAARAVQPLQIARIIVYAEAHGFDVPVMTGWSAATADEFYADMEQMVAEDVYTDAES